MSEEIARERESTRPERENPATPVPASGRASAACSPRACDPTAGGRDGMETFCSAESLYPTVVQGGMAPDSTRSTSAADRLDIRERSGGLALDRSDGEGKEWPGPPNQSSAIHHMAWPVGVEHTPRTPGMAGAVGKSSRCPGDDYSYPRGVARGEDSEAVTARHRPAGSPLRQQQYPAQAKPDGGHFQRALNRRG